MPVGGAPIALRARMATCAPVMSCDRRGRRHPNGCEAGTSGVVSAPSEAYQLKIVHGVRRYGAELHRLPARPVRGGERSVRLSVDLSRSVLMLG